MQKSQPQQDSEEIDNNLRKQLKSPTYSQRSCNRQRKISRTSGYTNSKKKLSQIHENLVELQEKFAHFQSTLKQINLNNIQIQQLELVDAKINEQKTFESNRKTQRPRVEKIIQTSDGKEKKNKKQKIRIDNKIYECKNIPSSYFQNIEALFQKQNKRSKTALGKKGIQNRQIDRQLCNGRFIGIQNKIKSKTKITKKQMYNQDLQKQICLQSKTIRENKFKISSPRQIKLKVGQDKNKQINQKLYFLNQSNDNQQKDETDKVGLSYLISETRNKQLKECNRMMKNANKMNRYCECCSQHQSASGSLSPSPGKKKHSNFKQYPINSRARYTRTAESGHKGGKQLCQVQDESKFQSQLQDEMDNSTDQYTKTHPNASKIYINSFRQDSARTKKYNVKNEQKEESQYENKSKQHRNNQVPKNKLKNKMTCQQFYKINMRQGQCFNNNLANDSNKRFIISKRLGKSNRNTKFEQNNQQQTQFISVEQSQATTKKMKQIKSEDRSYPQYQQVQHNSKITKMKATPHIQNVQMHKRKLTTDTFNNNKQKASLSPSESRRAQSSLFQKKYKKNQQDFEIKQQDNLQAKKAQQNSNKNAVIVQNKLNSQSKQPLLNQQQQNNLQKQQKQNLKHKNSLQKNEKPQMKIVNNLDNGKLIKNKTVTEKGIKSKQNKMIVNPKNSNSLQKQKAISNDKKYLFNKNQRNEMQKLSQIEETQKEDIENDGQARSRNKIASNERKSLSPNGYKMYPKSKNNSGYSSKENISQLKIIKQEKLNKQFQNVSAKNQQLKDNKNNQLLKMDIGRVKNQDIPNKKYEKLNLTSINQNSTLKDKIQNQKGYKCQNKLTELGNLAQNKKCQYPESKQQLNHNIKQNKFQLNHFNSKLYQKQVAHKNISQQTSLKLSKEQQQEKYITKNQNLKQKIYEIVNKNTDLNQLKKIQEKVQVLLPQKDQKQIKNSHDSHQKLIKTNGLEIKQQQQKIDQYQNNPNCVFENKIVQNQGQSKNENASSINQTQANLKINFQKQVKKISRQEESIQVQHYKQANAHIQSQNPLLYKNQSQQKINQIQQKQQSIAFENNQQSKHQQFRKTLQEQKQNTKLQLQNQTQQNNLKQNNYQSVNNQSNEGQIIEIQNQQNMLQSKIFVQVTDNYKKQKQQQNKNNNNAIINQNENQDLHNNTPLKQQMNNCQILKCIKQPQAKYSQFLQIHNDQIKNKQTNLWKQYSETDPLKSEQQSIQQQQQNKMLISFNKANSFFISKFNSQKSPSKQQQNKIGLQQNNLQNQNGDNRLDIIKKDKKAKSTSGQNVVKKQQKRFKHKSQLKVEQKKTKFTQSTYLRQQIKQRIKHQQQSKSNKNVQNIQPQQSQNLASRVNKQEVNNTIIRDENKITSLNIKNNLDSDQKQQNKVSQSQSSNNVNILDTLHILTQQSTLSMEPTVSKQSKQRKVSIQPSIPSLVNVVFQYVQSQGYFSYNSTPRVSIFDQNKHLVKQNQTAIQKMVKHRKNKSKEGSQANLIGYTDSQVFINQENQDAVIQNTCHFLSESTVRQYTKQSVCVPVKLGNQTSNLDTNKQEQLFEKKQKNAIQKKLIQNQIRGQEKTTQQKIYVKEQKKGIEIGIQCLNKIQDYNLSQKYIEINQENLINSTNKYISIQNWNDKDKEQPKKIFEQNNIKQNINNLQITKQINQKHIDCQKQASQIYTKINKEHEQNKSKVITQTNQQQSKLNHTINKKSQKLQQIITYNLKTINIASELKQKKQSQKQKQHRLKVCSNILALQQNHRKIKYQQAYSIVINTSSSMSENADVILNYNKLNNNSKNNQNFQNGNIHMQNDNKKNQIKSNNKNKYIKEKDCNSQDSQSLLKQNSRQYIKSQKQSKTFRKLRKQSCRQNTNQEKSPSKIQNQQTTKHLTSKINKEQKQNKEEIKQDHFQNKDLKNKKQRKQIKNYASIVPFIQLQKQIKNLLQTKPMIFSKNHDKIDLTKHINLTKDIMQFFDKDYDEFIDRLFTPLKKTQFWFYNKQFRIYSINNEKAVQNKSQYFNQLFLNQYRHQPQKYEDIRNYLKSMTGCPILKLENSKWSKIKNIKKHNNIYGFVLQPKGDIHRILGTDQIKQNQKILHLVKIKKPNGKCINMKWDKFINVYKFPFLIAINSQYFIRSAQIIKQKNENQFYIIDMICSKSSYDKMHCVIGLEDSEISQKSQKLLVTVYEQIQSNKYKNIGSGQASFVSMMIKQNNYMLVFEGCQKSNLSICCSEYIQLQNGRWAKNMQSAISCKDEQLIKYEQL